MSDVTFNNIVREGITTFHQDGTRTHSHLSLINGSYAAYHPDGSYSYTYKNLFDKGYTTHHSDGTWSVTYKNLIHEGYTTYHPDGSRSITYKSILHGGYITHHISKDMFGAEHEETRYEFSPGGWLGSAIEQVSKELQKADDDLSKQLKIIDQTCSRLAVALNQAQQVFGNEGDNQIMLAKYYEAIRILNDTEGVLHLARKRIKDYVRKLRS